MKDITINGVETRENLSDEMFQSFKKVCEMISGYDSEIAAYVVERFTIEHFLNHETLNMSLSMAKETLKELTTNKGK